jgi:hypothetical protein
MKKDVNIEEMLDYVAVEKAPDDLIYKWKVEVELQKERKRFYVLLLRTSTVFSLVLAGFWYCFAVLKNGLIGYDLLDKIRTFFLEMSPIAASSTSSIASLNYYIFGAGIFSMLLAAGSLFWFYQGKKIRYATIRSW